MTQKIDKEIQDILSMTDEDVMAEMLQEFGSQEKVEAEIDRLRGIVNTAVRSYHANINKIAKAIFESVYEMEMTEENCTSVGTWPSIYQKHAKAALSAIQLIGIDVDQVETQITNERMCINGQWWVPVKDYKAAREGTAWTCPTCDSDVTGKPDFIVVDDPLNQKCWQNKAEVNNQIRLNDIPVAEHQELLKLITETARKCFPQIIAPTFSDDYSAMIGRNVLQEIQPYLGRKAVKDLADTIIGDVSARKDEEAQDTSSDASTTSPTSDISEGKEQA